MFLIFYIGLSPLILWAGLDPLEKSDWIECLEWIGLKWTFILNGIELNVSIASCWIESGKIGSDCIDLNRITLASDVCWGSYFFSGVLARNSQSR